MDSKRTVSAAQLGYIVELVDAQAVENQVGEWQIAIQQKLAPQKTRLLLKPSAPISIERGLLAMMEVLPNTICASEASFAYVTFTPILKPDLTGRRNSAASLADVLHVSTRKKAAD